MTTQNIFNLNEVHNSWLDCLRQALSNMDSSYLANLAQSKQWLPGTEKIFNAFSLPVTQINFVLFGESPYPRAQSANGYAFWDAAVQEIWSPTGLSKPVNRATSLRHLIKMLLIAEGLLEPTHTTQPDIARIDKKDLVQTNKELFTNFIDHGFLLLNATLVLQPGCVRKDARLWHPFVKHLLEFLFVQRPQVQLILFGKVANTIDHLINHHDIKRLYAEHPYNHSFVTNVEVQNFFQPLKLLKRSLK